MHILRMGVWWSKQALHLNAVVYFSCKIHKFGPMHLFALIFGKTAFGSGHLGWT